MTRPILLPMMIAWGLAAAAGCSQTDLLETDHAVLSVETPRPGTIVKGESVMVRGRALGVAQVVIDDTPVRVSDKGVFAIVVGFEEGARIVRVEAEGVPAVEVPIVVDTGPVGAIIGAAGALAKVF